jgi:hypothetical protein
LRNEGQDAAEQLSRQIVHWSFFNKAMTFAAGEFNLEVQRTGTSMIEPAKPASA